jgi:hypothetical protein
VPIGQQHAFGSLAIHPLGQTLNDVDGVCELVKLRGSR